MSLTFINNEILLAFWRTKKEKLWCFIFLPNVHRYPKKPRFVSGFPRLRPHVLLEKELARRVGHWRNDTDKGNPEEGENPQCHSFHHKSHTNEPPEPQHSLNFKYSTTKFLPYMKHSVSITKPSQLLVQGKTMVVYVNRTQHCRSNIHTS